ncbi:MAG: hypothetical protein Kow0031_15100 [Anaerolineae bacterium]
MRLTHREQIFANRLHRLTGIGLFLFLVLHAVHIGLMAGGPEVFDAVTAPLRHPVARLLHLLLFFCVLAHAINGIRLIALDFAPPLRRFERPLLYAAALLLALAFIPSGLLILMDAFLPAL